MQQRQQQLFRAQEAKACALDPREYDNEKFWRLVDAKCNFAEETGVNTAVRKSMENVKDRLDAGDGNFYPKFDVLKANLQVNCGDRANDIIKIISECRLRPEPPAPGGPGSCRIS